MVPHEGCLSIFFLLLPQGRTWLCWRMVSAN